MKFRIRILETNLLCYSGFTINPNGSVNHPNLDASAYRLERFTGVLDKNGKELWEYDNILADYGMDMDLYHKTKECVYCSKMPCSIKWDKQGMQFIAVDEHDIMFTVFWVTNPSNRLEQVENIS